MITTRYTYDYSNVTNKDFAMPVKEVIEDLYHWPICGNCAAGLSSVDIEELEACSQCGYQLNPSDYEENGYDKEAKVNRTRTTGDDVDQVQLPRLAQALRKVFG